MNDDTQTPTPQDNTAPHDEHIPTETPATDEHAGDPRDEKIATLEASWQRAVADLQNYRRQAEDEKQHFAKFAAEKAALAVLPALDNLQRASAHCPAEITETDYAKGVMAVQAQLEQSLEGMGVKKIDSSISTTIDPARHQAIGTGAGSEGTIIEVFEEGYELNGKVIRLAKVRAGDGSA